MTQIASATLEPFKKAFVQAVAELHSAVKANNPEHFLKYSQNVERATDEIIREVRKVCQGISDQTASMTLRKCAEHISITVNSLVVAARTIHHEEDNDRLVDIAFEVAKSMQELMSNAAAIRYTPGVKASMTPRISVGEKRRPESIASAPISTPVLATPQEAALVQQYDALKEQYEDIKISIEKMNETIKKRYREQYPFIADNIIDTATDILEGLGEIQRSSLDPTFAIVLEQQENALRVSTQSLAAAAKLASGVQPPDGADDNLRVVVFSIAGAVKQIAITLRKIAQANTPSTPSQTTPNPVPGSSAKGSTTNAVDSNWFDQELEELDAYLQSLPPPEEEEEPQAGAENKNQVKKSPSIEDSDSDLPPTPPITQEQPVAPFPETPSPKPSPSDESVQERTPSSTPVPSRPPSQISTTFPNFERTGSVMSSTGVSTLKKKKTILSPLNRQSMLKSFSQLYSSSFRLSSDPGSPGPNSPRITRVLDPEFQKQKQIDRENDEKLEALEKEIFTTDGIVFKGEGEEKEVKAGTLERLVAHLTWHRHPDLVYNTTFLLTYRSFTTPSELLTLLMRRFELPVPEAIMDSEEKRKLFAEKVAVPVQLRVFNIMKTWLDKHFYDFKSDQQLRQDLDAFIANLSVTHPNFAKQLQKVLVRSQDRKDTVVRTEEKAVSGKMKTMVLEVDLLTTDELELAQQLTAMEFQLYSAIQPKELLNQSWNDYKKTGKKSNVNLMIDSFNDVSKWVATEVVTGANEKKRAAVIKYFITVGQYCRKLQNFNALMAIVAGLNGSAVHRLRKSWDLVPPKKRDAFEELQQVMSQQNNYITLRNLLHSVDPPCIPYLGMYLTDLTFIEDGNADVVDSFINFDKRRKISFVIREVQQYQLVSYDVPEDSEKQNFISIRKQNFFNDDQLYEKSLIAEPRK